MSMAAAQKLVARAEDGAERRAVLVAANNRVRGTLTSLEFELSFTVPEDLQHAAGTSLVMTGIFYAASG